MADDFIVSLFFRVKMGELFGTTPTSSGVVDAHVIALLG
jgi:hypothetical protein